MPFRCSSCGTEQPNEASRFCHWCGCKLQSSQAQEDAAAVSETGTGPLIHPLPGSRDKEKSISSFCSTHTDVKAVGLCEKCKDLVCLKCWTQKPQRHGECGGVLSIEEVLAKKDLFSDTRTQLSQSIRGCQSSVQNELTTKQQIEDSGKTLVSGLQDLKVTTVQTLDKNYQHEVSKLTAARDKQQKLVENTIQAKVQEVEKKVQEQAKGHQRRIESMSYHIASLTAVEKTMSKTLEAATLEEHVRANKEANDLKNQVLHGYANHTITGMSSKEETHLKGLAELPLEVRQKLEPANLRAGQNTESEATPAGSSASSPFRSGATKPQIGRSLLQRQDAVMNALRLGSEVPLQPGKVPILWLDLFDFQKFATGASDSVPNTFNQHLSEKRIDKLYKTISSRCAEALVTELGGRITHKISYWHGGLIMEHSPSSQVERFKVEVLEMKTLVNTTRWAKRDNTIGSDLKPLFETPIRRLADGAGQVVNPDMTWRDWWPTAHVKNQKKELRVWLM